jgi:prolyl-tRNA editing enzyme YbaK/EbsC (Cys-tRNA(Pro) deacylase)
MACETSFRTIDDVLADLWKAAESPAASQTLARVRAACAELGFTSACFVRVPGDYYDLALDRRRELIGAPSVACLCKSLILENTACDTADGRYYCVVVQYVAALSSHKLFRFVRENLLQKATSSASRSDVHFRMADAETALRLTGFEHNAISPIGMTARMPVIIAKQIAELVPDWFWLGGGQVDLKLGFKVSEFISRLGAHVADIYK